MKITEDEIKIISDIISVDHDPFIIAKGIISNKITKTKLAVWCGEHPSVFSEWMNNGGNNLDDTSKKLKFFIKYIQRITSPDTPSYYCEINQEFNELAPILRGFTYSDLAILDYNEFLSLSESESDKILTQMKIFYDKKIKNNGTSHAGDIIMRRKLFSVRYNSPIELSFETFVNNELDNNPCRLIDIADNNLLDDDLPLLLKLVSHRTPEILVITGNRFYCYPVILDIISIVRKWIIAVGIPVISLKNFFRDFTPDMAKKLIWLRNHEIDSKNWHHLIKSEEIREIMIKTHLEYYDKRY